LPIKNNRGTAGLNGNNMVRAKVKVHEITELQGWDSNAQKPVPAKRFKMQIVSDGSDENKLFSHMSGGTNIELQTINKDVFDFFKVMGEYYVNFTDASPVVVEEPAKTEAPTKIEEADQN
jgi:hypothetical protein